LLLVLAFVVVFLTGAAFFVVAALVVLGLAGAALLADFLTVSFFAVSFFAGAWNHSVSIGGMNQGWDRIYLCVLGGGCLLVFGLGCWDLLV
jgi:hypothetical protein